MENNFCAKCGAKLQENARFCIKCGNMVYVNPQPEIQHPIYTQPPVNNFQPEYVQPSINNLQPEYFETPTIQQTPVLPPVKTASWWLITSVFFGAFILLTLVCFVI